MGGLGIVAAIFSLYGLGALFVIVAIIVLVIRRVKNKDKENFEKRDN
ncbi:MAG: hypothetical protein JXL97_07330 [Bacteroidales bacterium]|nr:hypothetical protein [Bacteroidales bacterium]